METVKQFIAQFIAIVISPDCHDEFFVKMNFLHVPCLKAALSKGLGLGIVVGSSMVKLPQVVKIVRSGSAEGINIYGVLMELLSVSGSTAYCFVSDFPFSTYGEGIFLIVQTAAIALLVLRFCGHHMAALVFLLTYPGLVYLLVSGMTPLDALWALQTACVPIMVTAKLMQAFSNFRNGSTGQLSAITVFLLFLGSLARIFTSVQDTGDTTLIVTYISNSMVNGLLALQVLYYWNSVVSKPSKSQRRKANKKSKKVD